MGLLNFDGEPLSWEETKKYASHVREHGITQFLNIYEKLKNRHGDILKWGDEVEYSLLHFDHENRKVQLVLRGEKICEKLMEKEENDPDSCDSLWRKEYARYMIEGTPGKPYGGLMAHFNMVEANMALRRKEVEEHLHENERIASLTVFPRLGCDSFTLPEHKIEGPESNPVSRSLFYPDGAITSHPRFSLLTRNIRERRGKKVAINVPIFKDVNTPSPFQETFPNPEANAASKPDHIYMDCMGFGMGNSCLQLTFQACNIDEARKLYDELATVCPLMLALSAASPIFRGYLADIDVRWNVISASVDCRTDEERGLKPLKNDRFVIRKSRYDSIDSYLSRGTNLCNDLNLEVDEGVKKRLEDAGIDETLAQHIAHLWIRDPMTLFSKKINLDDANESDHFENLQSTNWQSMRFKPPPPKSSIGWRVEFRVCEAQLTDFENAAFVVFIVLLTRVILTYKLEFLMPISMVDENMQEAHKNDAARKSEFWFRRNVQTNDSPQCCSCLFNNSCNLSDIKDEMYQKMSLDTIVNGKPDVFPGFIPLIKTYLNNVEVDIATRCSITEYLNLISKRASGEYLTTAQWMRDFVLSHDEYKKDSVVTDGISYDLLWKCDQIAKGEVEDTKLFCKPKNKSSYSMPPGTRRHNTPKSHMVNGNSNGV
uniref:glutamate--cysteine ligase catalytic subunit-like n=1 Tax=Styela clava TaxID=7725 RepID=UPI00193ADE5E|nr:glutamate--cysteine ligase catalytic subunit-like [Styela clava]